MHKRSVAALGAGLLAIAAFGQAGPGQRGASHVASLPLSAPSADFGGLSGIELDETGTRMTAISDRGSIVTATVLREGGHPIGLSAVRLTPMKGQSGQPLSGDAADAEGLASSADGTLFVAYENRHRVLGFSSPAAVPARLAGFPASLRLGDNAGIEALAIDAGGRLFAVPEFAAATATTFPVLTLRDGAWSQAFTITRKGAFLPVGADFGPDGALYLLERHFSVLGFRSRIRRIAPDNPDTQETLLLTPTRRHGNLEGISAWRDASGAIRLTMVADDNFNPFQRTELVEYVLP